MTKYQLTIPHNPPPPGKSSASDNHTANLDVDCFPQQDKQLVNDSTSNGIDIQSFNTDDHGFDYRTDKNINRNKKTRDNTANLDVDCFPQ